jgi:hypothetical protein
MNKQDRGLDMAILTPEEKEFLDVFLYEATNQPFFKGPASKAFFGIGAHYHEIYWMGWAYHREVGVNPDTYTWGHPAEVAPPLPWPDRETVLQRNREIERLAQQMQEPAKTA